MILYILLGVIVIFVLLAILGSRDSRKIGETAVERVKQLEQKYEEYVEKHFTHHVIQNKEELDIEALEQDIMTYLKPDIDGLLGLINSAQMSSINVNYQSKYFPNVVGKCEELFLKSRKNENDLLNNEDVLELSSSVRDAVAADIKRRTLNLKMGDL